MAADLGVSYSTFRKTFKTYTGMAPGQYLIQLKIEKAKALLSDPSRSVKEIAYDLKVAYSVRVNARTPRYHPPHHDPAP